MDQCPKRPQATFSVEHLIERSLFESLISLKIFNIYFVSEIKDLFPYQIQGRTTVNYAAPLRLHTFS